MGAPSKIDRLIELGLSRYGAGDLEGALLMWEEALAIDPDNKQASSYVDYVRLHFELLGSEPEVTPGDEVPFGIEEEPEYQIELTAEELGLRDSQPVLSNDEVDAGWFDEESATRDAARVATTEADVADANADAADADAADDSYELELEAEPPSVEIDADLPPPPEVSFEPATREYYGTPTLPALSATPTTDFADTGTDGGTTEFRPAQHTTDVGTNEFRPLRGTDSGSSEFAQDEYTGGFSSEGTPLGFAMQSTEVRKRDFGFVQPVAAPEPETDKDAGQVSVGSAQTVDNVSLEKTTERPSFNNIAMQGGEEPDEEDLLATLPNPRRPNIADVAATQDIPVLPAAKAVTKELPDTARRPAKRDSEELSQAEVMLRHAPTQDFNPARIDISAPTRDLGIRPRSASQAGIDDEAVTKQSDVRAIRDAAARREGGAVPVTPDPEGTRSDIALPFDPIDARAAEILEEVDANAPPDEARDDQTRRRIAALLERAVQWNAAGDTEKAVSAVDLAMSEDPNSALGQKLITRNRETIMSVFQGYLGDLERMPQLARPLHELQDAPISPRAAFLLSRIDGTLTIDELLDVSGMPRLEAFRHLCQLYLRGILR